MARDDSADGVLGRRRCGYGRRGVLGGRLPCVHLDVDGSERGVGFLG